jgi:hypothetical protein
MSDYYREQRAKGEAYERYIVWQLRQDGIDVARYDTQAEQYAHGDTTIGLEIKLDTKYCDTGNLFIEVAEKTRAEQPTWTVSGIFAASDAPWYGVGDYRNFFVFDRLTLQEQSATVRLIVTKRGTSRGFLLTEDRARQLMVRYRHWYKRLPDGRIDSGRLVQASEIRWGLRS